MFDDEKIPDENSMTKLANNYALRNVVKINQVNTLSQRNTPNTLWSQYTTLINSLSRLTNSVNRRDFGEYFGNLATQNEQELELILTSFPELNLSNSSNPIFNACPNPSVQTSLRNYLVQELRLIETLLLLYSTEDEVDKREQLFGFINRHIQNLITLISRSTRN